MAVSSKKDDSLFEVVTKKAIAHKNYLIPFVFITFAVLFAFYIRIGTATLPGLEDQAENSVMSQIENFVRQELRSQNPLLPEEQLQRLVQRELQNIRRSGTFQTSQGILNIDQEVSRQAEQWKSYFQTNGQTYLVAMDPHFFFKNAQLYARNGFEGYELRDGEPWMSKMLAPTGRRGSSRPEFHTWLMAMLFRYRGLDSDLSDLLAIVFFLPAIFAALCAIPAYFIIKKFTTNYAALFGTLIMVSVSTFVSRTVAGFVDTDAYNVLFPLLITASLLYAFTAKKTWVTITLAALAGFFQGFFFWAWGSAWFIFAFMLVVIFGHTFYVVLVTYLKEKTFSKSIRVDGIIAGMFILSSFIFTYVFDQRNVITGTYRAIIGSMRGIATFDPTNIWPNVFSSVAELSPASFPQIVSSVGGQVIFLISFIGLLGLALDFKAFRFQKLKPYIVVAGILWFLLVIYGGFLVDLTLNQKELFVALLFLPIAISLLYGLINYHTHLRIFLTVLLTIWMGGTIFMSLNGVRFILLLAPAFGLAAGIGFYYIAKLLERGYGLVFDETKTINLVSVLSISLLFLMVFVPMGQASAQISRNYTPAFDDPWYAAMEKIDAETAEDAIITSWWDFGHFFRAYANRGVTFDGATQTTPQSHWVGKLLLENDEEVAQDILQMLVCGGNEAFRVMYDITNDSTGGVLINKVIYDTFGVSPEETRDVLRTNSYFEFSEEDIDAIMEKLACENPVENIVITSEDMVGKAPVWAHWGLWDFTRKYVLDNYRRISVEDIAAHIDEDVSLISQYVRELQDIDLRARAGLIRRTDAINQWLAPYPSYLGQGSCQVSGDLYNCGLYLRVQGNTVLQYRLVDFPGAIGCRNVNAQEVVCGFSINTSSWEIASQDFPLPNILTRILQLEQNTIVTKRDFSRGADDILFVPSENGVQAIMAQYPLGGSIFTRLFFLDGQGSKYFEKFYDTRSITGNRVILWRTIWDHELP